MAKWDKQTIARDARRYNTRSEWIASSAGAYDAARRLGIVDQVTRHMKVLRSPKGFWTIDRVRAEARKYRTIKEWTKASFPSYQASFRLGIHEELVEGYKFERHPKYTMSRLRALAMKFKTIKDFKERYPGAYSAAYKRGILKAITRHMTRPWLIRNRKAPRREIYAAVFSDHSVYVGLSIDSRNRLLAHMSATNSAISERSRLLNGERPKLKIVAKGVSSSRARVMEAKVVDSYAKKGWIILNRAAAGALGSTKYYRDDQLARIAKRYKSRFEWQTRHPSSYQAARRRRKLNLFCKHMKVKQRTWTLEDAIKEGRKYKNRNQWQIANSRSYVIVRDAGKLDEIMPLNEWTPKKLAALARRCKSRTEFHRRYPGAYQAAKSLGMFETVCRSLPRPVRYEASDIVAAAQKCKTRTEFCRRFPGQYAAAKRMGIFNSITKHMPLNSKELPAVRLRSAVAHGAKPFWSIDTDTGERRKWQIQRQAAEELGVGPSALNNVLTGHRKSALSKRLSNGRIKRYRFIYCKKP